MALVKGTNSFVTVSEADEYFTTRIYAATWITADLTSKEQALVTASQMLTDQRWTGTAISEGQGLSFPRSGEYFDPSLGAYVSFSLETPKRVITATFELALHLLSNSDLLDATGALESIGIKGVTLSKIELAPLIPLRIKKMYSPLLIGGGFNQVWRAN